MAIKGEMEKPCIIYLVTNKVTGKRYIGITAQKYLSTRINQHFASARRKANNGAFYRALRKYPRGNFEWEIIERCPTITTALAREIEVIAAMKPEYNSTSGGDGCRGHRMPAASRKKLSDFHKGKAWRQGMVHTEETKARLSELGRSEVNLERWAKYANLGPKTLQKSVICLDDGMCHDGVAAAARHYGVDAGTVTKVCQGKRRATGGLVFKYAEVSFGT